MSAISLPLLGDLGPLWLVKRSSPSWHCCHSYLEQAISTHLEKDSDRLLLGRNKWNAIHMGASILAVLSVPLCCLLDRLAFSGALIPPVFVYVSVRNQKSTSNGNL